MTTAAGHRKRVKEKYQNIAIRTIPDYELLELILFYAIPRCDTKNIAKQLLEKFGSLSGVLNAESADLKCIDGIGDSVYIFFKALLDISSRLLVPTTSTKNYDVLNNWNSVINYCRLTMGAKIKNEIFRVLYLNKKNKLLKDSVHDFGTIDKVQVYPREIARIALELGASAVILVHNHPSGEAFPSGDDIEITKVISQSLRALNISVHDHIIVTNDNHFSFRDNKLV